MLYPEQFDALRRTYDCEKSMIESLARCIKWDASGGKSGSAFLKTRGAFLVIPVYNRVLSHFRQMTGSSRRNSQNPSSRRWKLLPQPISTTCRRRYRPMSVHRYYDIDAYCNVLFSSDRHCSPRSSVAINSPSEKLAVRRATDDSNQPR